MSHKRAKRRDWSDIEKRAIEAHQILEILEMYHEELDGFLKVLVLTRRIVETYYPKHQKVLFRLRCLAQAIPRHKVEFSHLAQLYRQEVHDLEHQYGVIEHVPLPSLLNYSISLGDLLELFPIDRIVEDFLDE